MAISSSGILEIATPEVFLPLLEPNKRYLGAWGGRGSGKSWFFASLIVERMVAEPNLRVVCIREVQRSLEMSAKRLIEDQIERMGVGHLFRILNTHIEGKNGSLCIFNGMNTQTSESIKSLEGFSLAFCEEAQALSQRSLDLLRPTIREANSTLMFAWNPHLPTDPIDLFLRGNEVPPDAVVVGANYSDNPWFPDVLRQEMEFDRARDIDRYFHVWEGAYQTNSDARVFKNWVVEPFEAPAGTFYYFGGDWGFAVDPTVLVRCFAEMRPKPERSRLFIDYEAWATSCEIDKTPDLFDTVPGARVYPIIADSARPETISYLRRHGFPRIESAKKGSGSVKEGVIFLQGFDIVIHPRCKHTIEEFKHYSYETDSKTDAISGVLQDKHNHVIDSVRYACEKLMTRSVTRQLRLAGH